MNHLLRALQTHLTNLLYTLLTHLLFLPDHLPFIAPEQLQDRNPLALPTKIIFVIGMLFAVAINTTFYILVFLPIRFLSWICGSVSHLVGLYSSSGQGGGENEGVGVGEEVKIVRRTPTDGISEFELDGDGEEAGDGQKVVEEKSLGVVVKEVDAWDDGVVGEGVGVGA